MPGDFVVVPALGSGDVLGRLADGGVQIIAHASGGGSQLAPQLGESLLGRD